jgi:hypothetical protein
VGKTKAFYLFYFTFFISPFLDSSWINQTSRYWNNFQLGIVMDGKSKSPFLFLFGLLFFIL